MKSVGVSLCAARESGVGHAIEWTGATGCIRDFRSINAAAPWPQHPRISDFRPLDLSFGALTKFDELY